MNTIQYLPLAMYEGYVCQLDRTEWGVQVCGELPQLYQVAKALSVTHLKVAVAVVALGHLVLLHTMGRKRVKILLTHYDIHISTNICNIGH